MTDPPSSLNPAPSQAPGEGVVPTTAAADPAARYDVRELQRSDIETLPPAAPEQVARKRTLPIVLFVATCLSTFWVGAAKYEPLEAMIDTRVMWATIQSNWLEGLTYMGAVLAILLTHEMGHFLQTVRYGIPASYPLCIPVPFNPIGTMGAVISMDGMRADRKQIFDIGIAGPLAGLIVAIPILWIGVGKLDLTTNVGPREIQLNSPVIVTWMLDYQHPEWKDKADWIGISQVNPWFMAGWVGMLITGLNMLPISQLDGGHTLYGLFGPRANLRPRFSGGGNHLRGNQSRTSGHLDAHADSRDPDGRQSPQDSQRPRTAGRCPLGNRHGLAIDSNPLLSAVGAQAVASGWWPKPGTL